MYTYTVTENIFFKMTTGELYTWYQH